MRDPCPTTKVLGAIHGPSAIDDYSQTESVSGDRAPAKMRAILGMVALRRYLLTLAAVTIVLLSLKPVSAIADDRMPIPPGPSCPASTDFIIPGTSDGYVYPWDVIFAEWMRLGGPRSAIGCPIGGLIKDSSAGDAYMQFDHGQIAVSPNVWERGVVAAYQNGNGITVDWTVSFEDPPHYNYTKFVVRWDFDNQHYDDVDPKPCERGDGDQCDVLADMTEIQIALLHYFHDTHLRSKGTFQLPTDHGDGNYRIAIEGCDEGTVGGSTCKQGWMHSVEVHFKAKTDRSPDYPIDLTEVPSATDVSASKTAFFARAAAFTMYNACQRLLPYKVYRNEEDYMMIIMAKLDYANYFQPDLEGDHCPGRDTSNRLEAFQSLAQQTVDSKAGTTIDSCPGCRTGEYDVALSGYLPIIYRFGNILPEGVYNHIVNDLLNKRGPLDMGDHSVLGVASETENHINMIESSRYLTNDLLFERSGDSQYDNNNNAVPVVVDGEPEQRSSACAPPSSSGTICTISMQEYWLRRLHRIMETDFIEYNSRPYQDYTMHSLQNLFSFARDPQVRTAAQMALNYVYAKLAASSNGNRRSVPYRRKAEFNDPNLLGFHSDPQAARTLMLVGDFGILTQTGLDGVLGPWYNQDQWTIESSYRIPDMILDLIINPEHRIFYQGLHHYADEIYASNPSFLISAGGHYASPAYKAGGILGKDDDIGLALPTTIMPTGLFLSRNDLIRFEGSNDNKKRSNMCVAPNFACGIDPVLPESMDNVNAGCFMKSGNWTFISFTQGCRRAGDALPGGFYAAIYERTDGSGKSKISTGFVEAFDAMINQKVTFYQFWKGVLARNGSREYGASKSNNVYVTTTDEVITFELAPDSRIRKITNGPSPVQSTTNMATGTIVQSKGTSGMIKITNAYTGEQLLMDDSDALNPRQELVSVAPYASDSCLPGFVWRGANPSDHVCVTNDQRKKTEAENKVANANRSTNGGSFGSDTCKQGFVWREALPDDHVCVTPNAHSEALWDNQLAQSRRARPL